MEIQRKTFPSAEFKVLNEKEGIAEMIVSVFHNIDHGGEIVMPGFFQDSIERRRTADGRPRVKGVWAHDWAQPVAKTLDARELLPGDPGLPESIRDFGGLWVRGQFNLDTQRGHDAFSDLQFGTVDEFSVGYRVKKDEWDEDTGVIRLIEGEWYEWAPVLVGMNPLTELVGTKGLRYVEHSEAVLAAAQEWLDRTKALAALRAEDGRTLSAEHIERLAQARDALLGVTEEIKALLSDGQSEPEIDIETLAALKAQFERTKARVRDHG
jgi:HK97 family phage prohead protease